MMLCNNDSHRKRLSASVCDLRNNVKCFIAISDVIHYNHGKHEYPGAQRAQSCSNTVPTPKYTPYLLNPTDKQDEDFGARLNTES
jgi:hypothetical protein